MPQKKVFWEQKEIIEKSEEREVKCQQTRHTRLLYKGFILIFHARLQKESYGKLSATQKSESGGNCPHFWFKIPYPLVNETPALRVFEVKFLNDLMNLHKNC